MCHVQVKDLQYPSMFVPNWRCKVFKYPAVGVAGTCFEVVRLQLDFHDASKAIRDPRQRETTCSISTGLIQTTILKG